MKKAMVNGYGKYSENKSLPRKRPHNRCWTDYEYVVNNSDRMSMLCFKTGILILIEAVIAAFL